MYTLTIMMSQVALSSISIHSKSVLLADIIHF